MDEKGIENRRLRNDKEKVLLGVDVPNYHLPNESCLLLSCMACRLFQNLEDIKVRDASWPWHCLPVLTYFWTDLDLRACLDLLSWPWNYCCSVPDESVCFLLCLLKNFVPLLISPLILQYSVIPHSSCKLCDNWPREFHTNAKNSMEDNTRIETASVWSQGNRHYFQMQQNPW